MNKLYTTLLFACFITSLVFGQATQLTIRGYSEGFYNTNTGKLRAVADPVNHPFVCDTASVEMIDTTTNQTVMCFDPVINTDGFGIIMVPSQYQGQSFFVSMRFKNTYHLVSSNTVLMSGTPTMLDLTDPLNVCCNFVNSGGHAKAYSGDVNYDGSIDVLDLTIWENDMHSHPLGYNISDINGDRTIDSLDVELMENNANLAITDDRMINCYMIVNGISNPDKNSLTVYPNPATSEINLLWKDGMKEAMNVSVFDLTGREVYKLSWPSDMKEIKIETNLISRGAYIIKIASPEKIVRIQKVLVE